MAPSKPYPVTYNAGVAGLPYFTPAHVVSPGTPLTTDQPGPKEVPTLFKPLNIRAVTLRNRIVVAPMCQFSSDAFGPETGSLTDYHVVTLGHYALKGAALVFIEATGVQPNGRISPNCPGLWNDDQIKSVRRVSDFIKSQGSVSGIQLAHAGRKGSTAAPWVAARQKKSSVRCDSDVGGWPENVVGPVGGEKETWDGKGMAEDGGFWPPRQLSVKDIQELVQAFADSAKRAVEAGIEVIEVHSAHGYLLHEFLSPITNQRTDQYGGSFENRIRALIEVLTAIRIVIPSSMPLFLRVSSTEWMENTELGKKRGSWDVESTIQLAKLLPALGVDLLDVSSGGNHPHQMINMFDSKDYQTKIASRIRIEMKKAGLELLIGAVGLITEAEQARGIVEDHGGILAEASAAKAMVESRRGEEPNADLVLIARQFMREPEWVLKVAWELDVPVAWPIQFLRTAFPKL
jgi:2,4-dienoyl-CoA reductase-like NADH-dependent reductase (Old Yellow Enzyme family)